MDILGIELGMSPQQVEQVLKARHPNSQIDIQNGYFTYTDGETRFNTDPSVTYFYVDNNHEKLEVYFTSMPTGPAVYGVRRYLSQVENAPPLDRFRQSLLDKYGPPADSHRGDREFVWFFPEGRKQCIAENKNNMKSFAMNPDAKSVLRRIQESRYRDADIGDFSECASFMYYSLQGKSGGLLMGFFVILMDVARAAKAEQAAAAWVEELQAKVVAERNKKGKMIDL
ncbi:hypothetical protein GCM10027098_41360 [Bowmanella dokdonensis]